MARSASALFGWMPANGPSWRWLPVRMAGCLRQPRPVTLWALPEGRLLHRLDGPGLSVWSPGPAADGLTSRSGGQDRRVHRWEVASNAALGPIAPEPPAGAMSAPPAATNAEGAEVFRACVAYHAVGPEATPMAGPTLHGLFGRRMGSVAGYGYSARLARGDMVWTAETLARLFLEGPDVMLPGTKMPVQRLENPEDTAALLRFLQAATR